MDLDATKLMRLIAMLVLFINNSFAQTKTDLIKPPTLKNGQPFVKYIRLGYIEKQNNFRVLSVQFKITEKGNLDTLTVSDNAPSEFTSSVREELLKLNGQWKPQLINGKPSISKWLKLRYYVSGYIEDTSECLLSASKEFLEAYQREAELFRCSVSYDKPYSCVTDYLEGKDYFLYPPGLSTVKR